MGFNRKNSSLYFKDNFNTIASLWVRYNLGLNSVYHFADEFASHYEQSDGQPDGWMDGHHVDGIRIIQHNK